MEENKDNRKVFLEKKLWPFLVSLGGASVMVLAFFIPSVQDQWDRYQSRKVISEYVNLGDEFYEEEEYKMAEDAYSKAFELSEEKRLDIEIKRLSAKVHRVNENPEWNSEAPDDLQEVDFQFLLHLQKDKEHERDRFYTLNSYGVFLASEDRVAEAHSVFQEAIKLFPNDVHTYINLGNLLDQEGKPDQAERAYSQAIALDSTSARVHYNLGLLLLEQNKLKNAKIEFRKAVRLEPQDSDAVYQLRNLEK